jgi:hypothetical protein
MVRRARPTWCKEFFGTDEMYGGEGGPHRLEARVTGVADPCPLLPPPTP